MAHRDLAFRMTLPQASRMCNEQRRRRFISTIGGCPCDILVRPFEITPPGAYTQASGFQPQASGTPLPQAQAFILTERLFEFQLKGIADWSVRTVIQLNKRKLS
jgi:hypothetical protein